MNFNKLISSLFLFKGIPEDKIKTLVSEDKFEKHEYLRGNIIYSPNSFEKKIGFVISGKCEVKRFRQDSSDIILNTLEKGDSFGVLAAFSDEAEFPTNVVAKTKCDLLFITANNLIELCTLCPEISLNIMKFMASKIAFLNKKIATYSSESVKGKLAKYILNEATRQASDELLFNCKKCSESLGSGRASIYRAISSLVSSELIKIENKKIIIIDRNGLERTTK